MRGDTAGPPADDDETEANGSNGGANGGSTPKPAAAALTDEPPAQPARLQGLELGPACAQCGGMMQRTGSCYTCSSCGNNTGCG
jgi:ribonucleoside-diphosphate reductase alpha chain